MKSVKILFLTLLFPFISFAPLHKYYVSVTQIEYVEDKASVQIVMRIFIDDFEKLLRKRYDNSITLEKSKNEDQIDTYIGEYLANKVKISIDNKLSSFAFLGKEYEDDIVFCYLEINNISDINDFEITNNLFFEIFKEQQNIIKADIKSKNKSIVLTSQNNRVKLNFD
ncbi:MAG: peptidase E [Bacteroidetes bacterium]|nr:MAG: peptidase E [Bacteroidota bacterium]